MGRPGRWRRFVLRPLVWSLALVALAVVGLRLLADSRFARERARALIETRFGEAIGRDVTLGDLEFELLPLTLVARDLVIPGDRPGAADFLRVRRLSAEGNLESLRHSVLDLSSVEIEGLEMVLELRPDGDNLPRLVRRRGGGRRLSVEIDRLKVDDSRVVVDEQQVDVRVDAAAVLVHMTGIGGTDLEGSVAAQEVTLGLPRATPARFSVAGKARLYSDRVEFSDVRATSPEAVARASGRVNWRDERSVDLTAFVDADAAFLDRLGYLDGEIAGRVHAEGTFGWRRERWGWRADVRSERLDLFGFRLEQIAGVAAGDGEQVRFDLEQGRFARGAASGRFEVGIRGGEYPARLDVALAGGDLDALLARFSVPVAGLGGEVDGDLAFDFPLRDVARGDASGTFVVRPAAGSGLPAAGGGRIAISGGRVVLDELELRAGGQQVTGAVSVALADATGQIDLAVRSEDLGELARLPTFIEPGALWMPTSGGGELDLRIDLARAGPRVEIGLLLADVVAPGASADTVRGRLVATDEALETIDLTLEREAARLSLVGRLPFAERDELALELIAEGWPAEEAAPWLPFELPVAGPLHGRLQLTGSLVALAGQLVADLEPASVAGLPASRLEVALAFDPQEVVVDRLRWVAEAGEIRGEGRYRVADEGLDFRFETAGLDLTLPPFEGIGAAGLTGSLVARGSLGGRLVQPEVDLTGQIAELSLDGALLAEEPAAFTVRLAADQLSADVDLGALGRLSGGGPWLPEGVSRLDFRLTSENLDRWATLAGLGALAGPDGIAGALDAEIALELPAGGSPKVAFRIPQLEFRHAERTIRSLEPVTGGFEAGELRLASVYLGSQDSADELFVSGRIRPGEPGELDLNFQASLAVEWLAPLIGEPDLAGRIDALARIRGSLARPAVNGQAEWSDGRYLPVGLPHVVDRVRALALFYPDAVVLDRFAADFAGGKLQGTGRVDLPGDSKALAYRFEVAAREVAPRWPAGWQLRGDADLVLASSEEGRQLRGDIRFDRVWYLQDLQLTPAQLVQRLLSRGRLEVAETDELLSTTSLALVVHGPGAVRVRNNVARLSGSADLAVRGTLARPVLFGDVTLESGGTVEYGGNRYVVERGEIAFLNPSRIEPLLDVVAHSRIDQYDVTLNLNGSLERLNTTFSSDPPLADLDILGLIATGAPVERAAFSEVAPAADTTADSGAAEALLYGQAASLLTARVGKLFGFDRLQVKPLTSGDTVSTAAITVGKRLSSRLYVTYSLDPSSTAQQVLQAEWRLSDNLVLVLTQNGNESYAVDARWESRF